MQIFTRLFFCAIRQFTRVFLHPLLRSGMVLHLHKLWGTKNAALGVSLDCIMAFPTSLSRVKLRPQAKRVSWEDSSGQWNMSLATTAITHSSEWICFLEEYTLDYSRREPPASQVVLTTTTMNHSKCKDKNFCAYQHFYILQMKLIYSWNKQPVQRMCGKIDSKYIWYFILFIAFSRVAILQCSTDDLQFWGLKN